tara:strand:+ start:30861 stop:31094 length:234 start_codon:yes stop_codon:yes gene_type:complete
MTDLDIELLAMEFAEPEPSTSPDWFLIGMGIQQAPEAVTKKAKEIYLQFLRFEATPFAETFNHVVEEFTAAKLQNRI